MSIELARKTVELLSERGETVATAESCTGGGICAALTDIPGSSEVVWGGIVSYANDAKTALLDVDARLLEGEGAVSESVAKAMAWGARTRSGTDWTVAVTGIAGPGGGSPDKPVGTVWIAWCGNGGILQARRYHFDGDRDGIRKATVDAALAGLLNQMKD